MTNTSVSLARDTGALRHVFVPECRGMISSRPATDAHADDALVPTRNDFANAQDEGERSGGPR